MRYYGADYLDAASRTIVACQDAIDSPNYAIPIKNIGATEKRQSLKDQDVEIAHNAYDQMNKIFEKLTMLHMKLAAFYGAVDTTAGDIVQTADTIKEIIRSSTASLTEISNMLRGVGEYSGVVITSKHIASAGLDKDKLKTLAKDAWGQLIDAGARQGYLNETAALSYVEIIKANEKSGEELSREDFDRLMKMYDHYVANRFGVWKDIRHLKGETIQNLIDVFEIINPSAQVTTDRFFADVRSRANGDETLELNISRIKYGMYTAPEKYRDIMLYYLPEFTITDFKEDSDDRYNHIINTLNIYLIDDRTSATSNDDVYDSFFHELGHGIDDVTKYFGMRSEGINVILKSDFRNHMMANIKNDGLESIAPPEQVDEVLDFVISYRNINYSGGTTSFFTLLPQTWSMEQQGIYAYLRQKYGGFDYVRDPYDNLVISAFGDSNSFLQDDSRYDTASDIIGAITNNKLGGAYARHDPEVKMSSLQAKTAEEVLATVEKKSYWYDGKDIKVRADSEFFAECFDNKVLGYGVEETRDVFTNAFAEFEKTIDQIHKDLPSQAKGLEY